MFTVSALMTVGFVAFGVGFLVAWWLYAEKPQGVYTEEYLDLQQRWDRGDY